MVELPKLKKLSGWLLYRVGAQPTEPRPRPVPFQQQWRFKWPVFTTLAFVVVIGVWWSVGPLLSQAQVGTARLSLRSSDDVLAATLQKAAVEYKLPVAYADGKRASFPLSAVGFSVKTDETIRELRNSQQSIAQRFMWWRPIQNPIILSAQPHVLHEFITQHITTAVQPSQDATISLENGEVAVHDAVTGKQYGLENPTISLLNHVAALKTQPLQVRLISVNPAVTAEELVASKTQLETVLGQPISFTINGKTVKPARKDVAAWLELTPNDNTKRLDIDINSGKVQEYINKIAAASVHPARDQIEVTRDDGSTSVLVAGMNGLDITNKQTIATTVANSALAGKGISAELAVSFSPYKTITTAAYPKWIEVDVTNKRMYAYEQTSLIRTFLVSAGAPKTPTVTGKYAIYSKYAQKDMRGRNVDGSNYFQPHVPWVNFFYRDYAIHGNYWRPTSYFGNINSSHGCVSTVPDEAAWIYDWAPIGTPVIVHT